MKIVIVNENDEIIGSKERDAIVKGDIYRVSALWITNSAGQILLAQRAYNKKHNPGKWGPAVAGTVEVGEDYDDNIIKEAEEELGLKNINPKKVTKVRRRGEHDYFCQIYSAVVDKNLDEFKIQKSEVENIKWMSREELAASMENDPENYLESLKKYWVIFENN
jgi:isopentenyl-diphosphate delta-isomerase